NLSGVPVTEFTVVDQVINAGASYTVLSEDKGFACTSPVQPTPVVIKCPYDGLPLVANSGSASFTITIKAVDGGLKQIANAATVAQPKNLIDVDTANNKTPLVTVEVLPVADLSIIKTGPS